jgi:hypothetical protein
MCTSSTRSPAKAFSNSPRFIRFDPSIAAFATGASRIAA